jgi:hypothetical protein
MADSSSAEILQEQILAATASPTAAAKCHYTCKEFPFRTRVLVLCIPEGCTCVAAASELRARLDQERAQWLCTLNVNPSSGIAAQQAAAAAINLKPQAHDMR